MPPGGTSVRGYQLGTVSDIAHDLFVSEDTLRLIEAAKNELEAEGADRDSYRYRSVIHAGQAYDISRRIPAEVVSELAHLRTKSEEVWAQARLKNDFASYAPYLEKIVALNRRIAEAIGYSDHPYDALLMRFEPGMTSAMLQQLFGELKVGIGPIMEKASRSMQAPAEFLQREFPPAKQAEFALAVAQQFGYDLSAGVWISPLTRSKYPLPARTCVSPRATTLTGCRWPSLASSMKAGMPFTSRALTPN